MIHCDELLRNVREQNPLIHCITNYVTVNQCANILLACGASPVMADDIREINDITTISSGLLINIGTLNHWTEEAMLAAGKRACELGKPIVFDPVGVGASQLRNDAAQRIIGIVRPSVIKGNASEIGKLAGEQSVTRGVDAAGIEDMEKNVEIARRLSQQTGTVVAITGQTDVVALGERVCCISNGREIMAGLTGTGCMLGALTAAFCAANKNDLFEATAASVAAVGLAGEIAEKRLEPSDGNSSYERYILDAVWNMTPEQLKGGAKIEMR